MKRVFAFIGFTSAITLFVLNLTGVRIAPVAAGVLLAGLLISLCVPKIRRAGVLPTVLSAALFSCLVFIFVCSFSVVPQLNLVGQEAEVSFHIVDIPETTGGKYIYKVKTDKIALPDCPQNITMKIYSKSRIDADYYDTVTARLKFKATGTNAFDSYGNFSNGIFLKSTVYDYSVEVCNDKPLNYYIINFRHWVDKAFHSRLDSDNAALASALLTGKGYGLSDETYSNFKICGISHIIAVSGLHISILYLALYMTLKKLGVSKYAYFTITIIFLLFYVAVADFSKSVIRACIMIAVLLSGRLINKRADSLNSLGFAAFILCLDPFAVGDVGAVLTVSATLGMIVIKKELDKGIRASGFLKYLADCVTVSIAAIIATLPTIWYIYGRVSLISIILNIIVIPTAELAIIAAVLFLMLFKIPIISSVITFLLMSATEMIIKSAELCARHFSFLYCDISSELFGFAIAGVLLICGISLVAFGRIKTGNTIIIALVSLLLASTMSLYNYSTEGHTIVTSNGCVITYYKNNVAVFDLDDKYDFYTLKSRINTESINSILLVNCDYEYLPGLIKSENEPLIFNNDKFDIDLCSDINVKCNKSDITVTVLDKQIIIDDDSVIVDDKAYYRNAYYKFGDASDYYLDFSNGSEIKVRRVDNG